MNAAPPEIGHLIITTKESGNIRNSPPQSAPSIGVDSPPLGGNFGPSAMQIVAFTAHDPENTARVVSNMCVGGWVVGSWCACVFNRSGNLISSDSTKAVHSSNIISSSNTIQFSNTKSLSAILCLICILC